MNSRTHRILFVTLALLAVVGIGGFLIVRWGPSGRSVTPPGSIGAQSAITVPKSLSEFDVAQWKEHKGIYRLISETPNSKYGSLLKSCNYSFKFDQNPVGYLYRGGSIGSVDESQQCDPSLSIKNQDGERSEASFEFFDASKNSDTFYKVDNFYQTASLQGFLNAIAKESGDHEIKNIRRFYLDGRVVDQVLYAPSDSIKDNVGDQRKDTSVQLYTWIHDGSGTLLVFFDGDWADEDLYQAIISTIRFQ